MARKCNICKSPQAVTFKERDRDTGEIKERTHNVPCLGHEGIHESFWNLHPNYAKYQRYYAQMRRNNARTANH